MIFIKLREIYSPEIIAILEEHELFRLRELWGNLLAYIYLAVPWKKVSGSELAPNIFQRRLVSAAKEQTILEFLDKICISLAVQTPFIPEELIHEIETYPDHLGFLRDKTYLFVAYAMKLSKELRRRKNQKRTEKSQKEGNEGNEGI